MATVLEMAHLPANMGVNGIANALLVACSKLVQKFSVLVELEEGHIPDSQLLPQISGLVCSADPSIRD